MSPYFSLNSISNSMVKRISRKGVLAITFLCLATYLLAFAGAAGAGQLNVYNDSWAGANQLQIDWGAGPVICNDWFCQYNDPGLVNGVPITVEGIPGFGFEFDLWERDISSTLNPFTFNFVDFMEIGGEFLAAVTMTLTNPGNGSGQLEVNINGRGWVPTPLGSGQVINLSVPQSRSVEFRNAAPDAGSVFQGYSGDGGASADWRVSPVFGGENVNATFDLDVWKFTVKVFNGPNENSIKLEYNTTSVSCPDTCTYDIPKNTTVTLTAIADAANKWMFEDWKKDGSGFANPYLFTVNADLLQVDAHFKQDGDYILTINKDGSGTGSVTASRGTGRCPYPDTGSGRRFGLYGLERRWDRYYGST
jgi:hypothetical protein